MAQEPRSILVACRTSFGRSLPLLPALKAIRTAHPGARITAAVHRGIWELLPRYDLVDEAIDLGNVRPSDNRLMSRLGQFARLASRARKKEFDLALDFFPAGDTQFAARVLVGARTIAPSGGGFLAGRSRAVDFERNYSSVLRQLDIKFGQLRPQIELTEEDNEWFEKLLRRSGSKGGEPIVALHSEMDRQRGNWPAEKFGEVAARLQPERGARVIAFDEPCSKEFTQAVAKFLPKGAIRIPSPRAVELLAAMARASLIVTDNRGLSWAATALGVPVAELAEASASVKSEARTHQVISSSSFGRVKSEDVLEAASQLLMENRSSLLFQR